MKLKRIVEKVVFNKATMGAFMLMFGLTSKAMATTGYNAGTQGGAGQAGAATAAGDAGELDTVWAKVAGLMSGTAGKLMGIGILVATIWNRDALGIPKTAAGVGAGVMLPNLPAILDKFVATI